MRASYIHPVVIVLFLVSGRMSSAQEAPQPRFGWAYAIGSPYTEASRALAWGPSGRVTCVGILEGPYPDGSWVDFDPGPGEDLFRAVGYDYDLYITQYKETGEYEWTRVIGGELHESSQGVALDDEGGVYVAGVFGHTWREEAWDYRLDVDPGPRVHEVHIREYQDALLVKLDRRGRYAWSYTVGGGGGRYDAALAVTTAPRRDAVYLLGEFSGSVNFNPGAVEDIHDSHRGGDMFLTCLRRNGEYRWTRAVGGESSVYAGDVAVDSSGAVYMNGDSSDDVDLNPGPEEDWYLDRDGPGGSGAIVVKLDRDGDYVWGRGFGSFDPQSPTYVRGIIANDRFVLTTGDFKGEVDFDPDLGNPVLDPSGYGAYLSCFSAEGDYLWTYALAQVGTQKGRDVALDGAGYIYWFGEFQGEVDLDPYGEGDIRHSEGSEGDFFVVCLDPMGTYQWGVTIPVARGDAKEMVANDDLIAWNAYFYSWIDINPFDGVNFVRSQGVYDIIHSVWFTSACDAFAGHSLDYKKRKQKLISHVATTLDQGHVKVRCKTATGPTFKQRARLDPQGRASLAFPNLPPASYSCKITKLTGRRDGESIRCPDPFARRTLTIRE